MQEACQLQLAAAGFQQYEVSAYARTGRKCRHNVNYWQFGDYLGLGAGAHGKLTDTQSPEILRTVRFKQPREDLGAAGAVARLAESSAVPARELPFEFVLNALRLKSGFSPALFEARTGLPSSVISHALQVAHERKLIVATPNGDWQATELGWRFLTDLQALFLAGDIEPPSGIAANAVQNKFVAYKS
jgi:oxygen-independent coproporphyrinogen-3 oxidase